MKINLGAGTKVYGKHDDWVNIDIIVPEMYVDNPNIDYLQADITKELPKSINEGEVDHFYLSHVIEHVYPQEAYNMLIMCYEYLKEGGTIALEQPDVLKCAINMLQALTSKDNNTITQWGLLGMYGKGTPDTPYMLHKWGYFPESLTTILYEIGFKNVQQVPTTGCPHNGKMRDFRLEALK